MKKWIITGAGVREAEAVLRSSVPGNFVYIVPSERGMFTAGWNVFDTADEAFGAAEAHLTTAIRMLEYQMAMLEMQHSASLLAQETKDLKGS